MNYVGNRHVGLRKDTAHWIAVSTVNVCSGIIFLSMVAMLVGMFLFETFWSPGPTIRCPPETFRPHGCEMTAQRPTNFFASR